MPVKSHEDFNTEFSENPDMMLFAEKFVNFMLLRNCQNYDSKWKQIPFRDHIYNAFVPIIQRVIRFLDYTLEMDHDDLFWKMKKANFLNSHSYGRFAKTLAAKYFPEGFDAKHFLIYCVNLSMIAAYFYNNGLHYAADLAKMHIYKFLQKYDVSASRWDTVYRIAENYEKMLQDSENEQALQSLDSDEIEPQDQPQEEVSDDESRNSSLNEGHNFLSGNEENNLEEQQERACLKNDQSLEESAQCSSDGRPEIGVSPLKDPESSTSEDASSAFIFEGNKQIKISESDDKGRPGISNVDQEPILLIISNCKKRMNLAWNEIKSGN